METSAHCTKTARQPEDILESQVQAIQDEAAERIQSLHLAVKVCESPIEQIFFLEYIDLYGATPAWTTEDSTTFTHTIGANQYNGLTKDHEVFIDPQAPITIGSKRYRADFLITIKTYFDKQWHVVGQLVVEIDGHDFHERTKEQAARDRSRDRAMAIAGYKVIRFTGSEVYRSPLDSLFELSSFIMEACR